jgi:hypothetical protein
MYNNKATRSCTTTTTEQPEKLPAEAVVGFAWRMGDGGGAMMRSVPWRRGDGGGEEARRRRGCGGGETAVGGWRRGDSSVGVEEGRPTGVGVEGGGARRDIRTGVGDQQLGLFLWRTKQRASQKGIILWRAIIHAPQK